MLVGTYVVIKTTEKFAANEAEFYLRKEALRDHYQNPGSPRFQQWLTINVDLARNWPEDLEYSLRDHSRVLERYLDNSDYHKHCFLQYEAFFEDFTIELPDCALITITGLADTSPPEACNIPSLFVKQFGVVKRYGQIGQKTVVHIAGVNDAKPALTFEEIEKGFQFGRR